MATKQMDFEEYESKVGRFKVRIYSVNSRNPTALLMETEFQTYLHVYLLNWFAGKSEFASEDGLFLSGGDIFIQETTWIQGNRKNSVLCCL